VNDETADQRAVLGAQIQGDVASRTAAVDGGRANPSDLINAGDFPRRAANAAAVAVTPAMNTRRLTCGMISSRSIMCIGRTACGVYQAGTRRFNSSSQFKITSIRVIRSVAIPCGASTMTNCRPSGAMS
jgi:hypothetical protein